MTEETGQAAREREAARIIERNRRTEYEICQRRGHQPSDITLTSNPPLSVCKWCGTHYHYSEPTLMESYRP